MRTVVQSIAWVVFVLGLTLSMSGFLALALGHGGDGSLDLAIIGIFFLVLAVTLAIVQKVSSAGVMVHRMPPEDEDLVFRSRALRREGADQYADVRQTSTAAPLPRNTQAPARRTAPPPSGQPAPNSGLLRDAPTHPTIEAQEEELWQDFEASRSALLEAGDDPDFEEDPVRLVHRPAAGRGKSTRGPRPGRRSND